MAKSLKGNKNPGGRTGVRIVVAGERNTGKSSLIVTAATEKFPTNVPPLLPPTRMPKDFYPERVPITLMDTSSRIEDIIKVAEELKRADAVVLTYACDQPQTLEKLSTFWLPKLRELELRVPVIVAGCRLDLRDENQQVSLEQLMNPVTQQFREIETWIECSAFRQIQIVDVFNYAQKAVLHPRAPIFDIKLQDLEPRYVRALKRIFILCDLDKDGALSDAELNDFQVKCFRTPLQPSEIVGVKRVVQEKFSDGVNDRGLTLIGFLILHALIINKGRLELIWTILRTFGYNNEIKLADELVPSTGKWAPDQSVELTDEAIGFLKGIFETFDSDNDGVLRPLELEKLFSTAPQSLWNEGLYRDSVKLNLFKELSLDGFLSMWAMGTLLDPSNSMENLICIGYAGSPSSAIHVTRRRRLDRKKQQSERNVLQGFVFGSRKAGKSSLLDSFVSRPYNGRYTPTNGERYAVNIVDQPGGMKKTLILKEIPEDGVSKLLSDEESLAACDIAVFVHDSSDENSWRRAVEILIKVATHGEDSGYVTPCLIVAVNNDPNSFSMATQDSNMLCQNLGLEVSIPFSKKVSNSKELFHRIVTAAQHPHLSIPEIEAGRRRKQYYHRLDEPPTKKLLRRIFSVGAAVAIVGLAACRVYATRKN